MSRGVLVTFGSWKKKHFLVEVTHVTSWLSWSGPRESAHLFLLPVGKLRLGERTRISLGHRLSGRARLTPHRHFLLHPNLMAGSGQCEDGMSYVGDRVYGKVRGDTWAGRQGVSPGLVGPPPVSDMGSRFSYLGRLRDKHHLQDGAWVSLAAQMVKNLPAMQKTQETRAQSLGWGDPLKKGMALQSGILAWRIPWTEEPDWLQRVGHD